MPGPLPTPPRILRSVSWIKFGESPPGRKNIEDKQVKRKMELIYERNRDGILRSCNEKRHRRHVPTYWWNTITRFTEPDLDWTGKIKINF